MPRYNERGLLVAALLWARNHYDTDSGRDPVTKRTVLLALDSLLKDMEREITIEEQERFRREFVQPAFNGEFSRGSGG